MSQVFAGDAVNFAGSASINMNTETVLLTGNFLSPPFQNAKAIVLVMLNYQAGASVTFENIRIRRNPSAENVQVAQTGGITISGSPVQVFSLQGADIIPDGRSVQYAVTAQQTAATGNGTCGVANVTALLISG